MKMENLKTVKLGKEKENEEMEKE